MKISIITPTYNSEKNISICIQSILNQTYKNFEHIIIDNLSADSTLQIAKNMYSSNNMMANLSIISEKDDGISDAFNKGINAANGGIIGILNSDDFYFSNDVFEKVVKAFSDPKILFVHGNILFKDDLYGSNIRKPLLCDVRKAMPYNHPTMFLRKELYTEIGLFDTSFKYAMDFDLVCRIKKHKNNLENVSAYLDSEPIAVMNAGGASWRHELSSINESKQTLINNGFWNSQAKRFYWLRVIRTRFKRIFTYLNLNFIVKCWRNLKWKN